MGDVSSFAANMGIMMPYNPLKGGPLLGLIMGVILPPSPLKKALITGLILGIIGPYGPSWWSCGGPW